MMHRPWTRTVDLIHTVLVDQLHRSKGYAIWSVDSEMDGSGGLGCFTWPEQGSDAVAAIDDGGSTLQNGKKGSRPWFPTESTQKERGGNGDLTSALGTDGDGSVMAQGTVGRTTSAAV